MTTVGTLPTNLVPGGDLKGPMSNVPPSTNVAAQSDVLPSSNTVPFIITTAAEDEKRDKPLAAPVNGGSPVRYLQASSKLDMEPNPFEQSFSGMTGDKNTSSSSLKPETPKPVLPPIEAMSGRLPTGTEFAWDSQSLRMGPLSPSMLEGPQNPIVFDKPQNPIPVGSFPTTTASISSIFTTAPLPPLADNPVPPFLEVPGPHTLPPPPAAMGSTSGPATEPFASNIYNAPQANPLPPQPGHGDPRSQSFAPSSQSSMSQRYMPGQAPPSQSTEAFGNLHLLSQAQATHREMWGKRENESNGTMGPSVMQGNVHHSHSMPHGHSHNNNNTSNGMAPSSAQPIKDEGPRGVRRSRMESEDYSDDSERSKRSSTHNSDTTSSHNTANNSNNNNNTNNTNNKNGTSTSGTTAKGGKKKDDKPPMDEEEKRRNFLERNRQAALKCRQRKKQWLSNLQAKVEYLTTDNEHLQSQTAALRDEIIHLKALLLAHKDCPVAQANGVYVDTISNPSTYNPQCAIPQPGRSHHPMGAQAPQQPPHGPPLPPGAPTGAGPKPMTMGPTGAVSAAAPGAMMGHGRGPLPPPPSQVTGSSPMTQPHNMARMPPTTTSAPPPPVSRGAMPMQAGVRY
ncbi:hypothetical protein BGW41_000178 [Actinomortierella wolfii]|nr:hypothetical protein BGW41_000178 [Actinomortierella wolfii]